MFSEDDIIGPTLHDACKAMESDAECAEKFVEKNEKKTKKKKRKKKGTRIVGGIETKYPMPWMVVLSP